MMGHVMARTVIFKKSKPRKRIPLIFIFHQLSFTFHPQKIGSPSSGTPHPGDAEEMAGRRGLQCRHGQSAAPSAGPGGAARGHGESPTRWRSRATAGADSGRGCGSETWLKAGESEERFFK